MMALRLEVFEPDTPLGPSTIVTDVAAIEQVRMEAYEQGYTAGWDDGVAAQAEDQTRLREDLGRSLQGQSFTFHEARAHVLRALDPLFSAMLSRLLPEVARAALAPMVAEALQPLAADLADAPVSVFINPAARPAVAALLAAGAELPVALVDEPLLAEGQAVLRLGQIEVSVDLDATMSALAATLRGFLEMSQTPAPNPAPQTEPRHG